MNRRQDGMMTKVISCHASAPEIRNIQFSIRSKLAMQAPINGVVFISILCHLLRPERSNAITLALGDPGGIRQLRRMYITNSPGIASGSAHAISDCRGPSVVHPSNKASKLTYLGSTLAIFDDHARQLGTRFQITLRPRWRRTFSDPILSHLESSSKYQSQRP